MRALVAALAITLMACADTHDLPIPPGAHVIEDRALDEMSGLEPSAVDAGMLWAINNRALPPRLYRTGVDGSARVRLAGSRGVRDGAAGRYGP